MRRCSLPILFALLTSACQIGGRGVSTLIGAARSGDAESVYALIERGSDPNRRGGVNNWTPLMHAVHKHRTGAAIALVKGGAEIDARTANGTTALMMAAGYGYADMVRALLDRGADAHLTNGNGETALTQAMLGSNDIDEFTAGNCQTETVRVLLDRSPDLKLNDRFADQAARWLRKHGGCREVAAMLR